MHIDWFQVFLLACLFVVLGWATYDSITTRRNRKKREEENKRLREVNHPVKGQVYQFADNPDLEFTSTEIDDKKGEVSGTLTIYLPAGARVVYFDASDFEEIEVRYLVTDGKAEVGHNVHFDADSIPNPQGLEGWDIWYNDEIVFENR